tara:strand:+ start:282 stop:467 length:186 start_codon:yes stop_codon:yes gene_type:complete
VWQSDYVLDVTFNKEKSNMPKSNLRDAAKVVTYSPFDLTSLELGYAVTIHKAQVQSERVRE